jgi:two-component system sensor histidine kinase BaeS
MKIKVKLITVMTGVVLLMMLLFYFLVQVQFFIIRDLSYFSNQKEIKKIEKSFIDYYKEYRTWEGIKNQPLPTTYPFILTGTDYDQTIWKNGNQTAKLIYDASFPVVLKLENKKIGHLFVLTPKQYQVYLIKTTWDDHMYGVVGLASLLGIVVTVLVIYLVSATLTRPIRQLIKKIKRFEQGDTEVNFHLNRKDEFKEIGDALASMKENLEKAENARRTLVSDVAHELKTPLMVIQGELELLHIRQKPVSSEKYESVANEITRMTSIIDDILHLSKAEAHQISITRKRIKLIDLFEQLEEKTRFLFAQYQSTFHYPKDTKLEFYADEEKMIQILYNLIQNALIHGHTTTTVKMEVNQSKKETQIAVVDNGVGIKEEDLAFIFERFYRADESRNRKTGGTGIGLSIVKAYVEIQGGKIEVQSEPQKGTSFVVCIPTESSG